MNRVPPDNSGICDYALFRWIFLLIALVTLEPQSAVADFISLTDQTFNDSALCLQRNVSGCHIISVTDIELLRIVEIWPTLSRVERREILEYAQHLTSVRKTTNDNFSNNRSVK